MSRIHNRMIGLAPEALVEIGLACAYVSFVMFRRARRSIR